MLIKLVTTTSRFLSRVPASPRHQGSPPCSAPWRGSVELGVPRFDPRSVGFLGNSPPFHEDFTSNLMVLWWSKTHQKNEGKGAILHDLTNTQGDWCLIYVGKIGANHEHVIAGQMIDIEAIDGDYDYKPTKIADGHHVIGLITFIYEPSMDLTDNGRPPTITLYES